jgi:hypothetical protein
VTIIAGFRCLDGIVLCADTQETLGTSKRNVPKLRFEPSDPITEIADNHSNLAAAFCGAGDGPFIDKLIEESWRAAKTKSNLSEACDAVEVSIKRQYKEFGSIYQPGECPEVQLIFGMKMDGQSRLFTAIGPIVNEKFGFDSGGIGHYMADFLASKMHHAQMTSLQCAILATYILVQAKEHVDGCGGDSQIAILRNTGTSGLAWDWRMGKIAELVAAADDTAGEIIMEMSNFDQSDEKTVENVNFHLKLLHLLRESYREETKKQETPELHKSLDFLGLPLPKESM